MDKKKLFLILGCCLAALCVLLMMVNRPEQGSAQIPEQSSADVLQTTAPQLQTTAAPQTQPTVPVQTEPMPTQTPQTQPDETQPQPAQTRPVYTEPAQTEPPVYDTVEFPVELEGGQLTVQSLFPFSGMNPDADNAQGENIAAIQIVNTSGMHLREAQIFAVLADGTELNFQVRDLPAGMSAMAFNLDNEPVERVESCEDMFGWAEFESGDVMRTDLVEISVDGMEVTVRNISGKKLTDLDVYCHSLLDDSCFGGVTYCYTIDSLSAGQSATVYAWDCILGMAQVVRVELGD